MLNLLLIAALALVPVALPDHPIVSPTRVDGFLKALLCDRAASSVQSYFDHRAYRVSFLADCVGVSTSPNDKETVLRLLFELTSGGKDQCPSPCDAELWRGQRIVQLTTRAGLFSESGPTGNEMVLKAVGAKSYCTSVVVVRSVVEGEPIEAALVLVWAQIDGRWVIAQVEMVCV